MSEPTGDTNARISDDPRFLAVLTEVAALADSATPLGRGMLLQGLVARIHVRAPEGPERESLGVVYAAAGRHCDELEYGDWKGTDR